MRRYAKVMCVHACLTWVNNCNGNDYKWQNLCYLLCLCGYTVWFQGHMICLGKKKWWLCFGYWFAYAERHWNVQHQVTVSETRDTQYKSLQILWQLVRTESERKQASQIKKYFFKKQIMKSRWD